MSVSVCVIATLFVTVSLEVNGSEYIQIYKNHQLCFKFVKVCGEGKGNVNDDFDPSEQCSSKEATMTQSEETQRARRKKRSRSFARGRRGLQGSFVRVVVRPERVRRHLSNVHGVAGRTLGKGNS